MRLLFVATIIWSVCLQINCQEDEAVTEEPEVQYVSPFTFEAREAFFQKEKSMAIGGSIKLSEKEKDVNAVLMHFKRTEHNIGLKHPEKFLPSRHFFEAKQDIEESPVFGIIRQLPKGANLHTHLPIATSGDYLYELTQEEHLYICMNETQWYLRFFDPETDEDNHNWKKRCDWQLVKDLRENDPDFEDWLRSKFTMVVDDPYTAYPTSKKAWEVFEERVKGIGEMLYYWPVFGDQFYQTLEEMHEDNVMYLEFRAKAPGIYQLNNTAFPLDGFNFWGETLRVFKEEHPGFFGAKIIYTHNRDITNGFLLTVLNTFNKFSKIYPELVAGFDLSGREDGGRNLTGFAPFIKDVPNVKPLLLHAGETNWYGVVSDNNLIDAVMMDVSRIGHGLALPKHPEVMRMVKEKAIAIEVCPISNQVFRHVDDMRNHPAAVLFANDIPVVIGNDGPAFWGYKGLSYDWYMAFMGIASRDADLRMLKQLALNSINHSSMELEEKFDALQFWYQKWDNFLDNILFEYKDSKVLKKRRNSTNVDEANVKKDEL